MSVAVCDRIDARLRELGITVHEWAGWRSRGNGQTPMYRGGLVHHTGSAYGSAYQMLVSGRSDLPGPLCNYSGNADGSITVISGGPANHAGASGGRSMGPLPVTSSFNKYVLGLEIVYPGSQPMTAEQYRSALVWAHVVAEVVGSGDIECIRAHAETSITGKWDPGYAPGKTIDMAAFRAAARVIQEAEVSLNDDPITDPYNGGTQSAAAMLGYARVDAYYANVKAGQALDAVRAVSADVQAAVVSAFREGLVANPPAVVIDYAALAKAVNDDRDARDRDGNPATGNVS